MPAGLLISGRISSQIRILTEVHFSQETDVASRVTEVRIGGVRGSIVKRLQGRATSLLSQLEV